MSVSRRGASLRSVSLLVPLVSVPLLLMVWASYRATAEWQRGATRLAAGRAETAASLLETAFARDMRAVQTTVLPSIGHGSSESNRMDTIASAFARYPYPESFFTWSATHPKVTFYTRTDRYPQWMAREDEADLFPAVMTHDDTIGKRLAARVAQDAARGRRHGLFDMQIDRDTYQVVCLIEYQEPFRERLQSVSGFMVNVAWARAEYFKTLTAQVSGMPEVEGIALGILDAGGASAFGSPSPAGSQVVQRPVQLLFFDPRLVAVRWPEDLQPEVWTIQAVVSADPALRAANIGAWRTLAVGSVSAVVLAVGVVLVARAARARVRLSELRSEFVSTVTHELKTPLASIQTVAETFASDRGITPELSRKYGRLTLQEVKRLRRQVDNLLAYGRMSDVDEFYSFEELSPHRIAERVLKDFSAQLDHLEFETAVDVPATLPHVWADDKAMQLVLSNLIDNAIRYSAATRALGVRAFQDGEAIVFEVSDRGVGVPEEDLPHVTRRFFRGRSTEASGSGLGLAIVERIVNSHKGTLRVRSSVGSGTTVSVSIPIARAR